MKKSLVAVAAIALLALTGCADEGTVTTGDNATTEQAPAAESKAKAKNPAFGDTYTWENGVAVTVTGKFQKAGQYASGAVDGNILVFTTTIKNNSDEDVDATLMSAPQVKAGDPLESADMAFDEELSFDMASTISPGESQKIQTGFGLSAKDAKNIQFEVSSPDLMDKQAIFKGSIN